MIQKTTDFFRRYRFVLLLCLAYMPVYAQNEIKSLSDYLDYLIGIKQELSQPKEQKISSLKLLLDITNLPLEQEYDINLQLYEEYKIFVLDSAIYYVKKNLQIAHELESDRLAYSSRLQLARLYSYSGLFRESEEILKSIDPGNLPADLLSGYYEAYCLFFEHYGALSSQYEFVRQKEQYRDSLLMVLEPESFDYKKHLALKHIYLGEIDPAKDILFNLLETEEENTRNYAFTTYYLGLVYEIEQNPELVKKYYLLSAIADIKSSIRENASFQKLASIYYEEGDIDKAFRYTQSAIEDAVFCNVQFRTTQMSRFYSIINATYAEKESEAKAQLLLFLMLISLLSLLLVLLVVYVYRQMRKLSRVKEELSVAYDKLIELNNVLNKTNQQLLEKNDQLSESNLVKEQYIAQFFDLCSAYIDKMEDYRKSLYKLGINDQIDKLIKKLKSTTEVDKELEDLYKNFDRIFLNLYPTFVSDFNSLLIEEERIILKSEGILNKELRIYALLRLGITDSVRIAAFLRCSLSTVYNYRTKIRNKAAISREEFEIVVEKIGSIRKNNE